MKDLVVEKVSLEKAGQKTDSRLAAALAKARKDITRQRARADYWKQKYYEEKKAPPEVIREIFKPSSWIGKTEYFENTKTLRMQSKKNGAIWDYHDIEKVDADALKTDDWTPGTYLWHYELSTGGTLYKHPYTLISRGTVKAKPPRKTKKR